MKITHHKNGEIKTLVEEAPYHPGYEDAGFKPNPIKSKANELADALQETEPYYSTDYKLFDKAATMLRQQQAEIEALKDLLEAYRDDNRTSESFDRTASHMAGEYVAHSTCNGFCGEYECKENKTNCLRKAQEK